MDLPAESFSRFLNAVKLPAAASSSNALPVVWREFTDVAGGTGRAVAASCSQVVGRAETLSRMSCRIGMAKLTFCASAFVQEAMPITSPRGLRIGLPLFPGEIGQDS